MDIIRRRFVILLSLFVLRKSVLHNAGFQNQILVCTDNIDVGSFVLFLLLDLPTSLPRGTIESGYNEG
jgi:hypothetical protein